MGFLSLCLVSQHLLPWICCSFNYVLFEKKVLIATIITFFDSTVSAISSVLWTVILKLYSEIVNGGKKLHHKCLIESWIHLWDCEIPIGTPRVFHVETTWSIRSVFVGMKTHKTMYKIQEILQYAYQIKAYKTRIKPVFYCILFSEKYLNFSLRYFLSLRSFREKDIKWADYGCLIFSKVFSKI